MKFTYKRNEKLPPLAWLAYVKNGVVEVTHGSMVETNDRFFVDGAWNGNYIDGGFSSANWFCGTGAEIINDSVVFSTPSHVTAGLYSYHNKGGIYVSNSLQFLLVMSGLKFDPQYKEYEIDLSSILKGIYQYKEDIRALKLSGEADFVKSYFYRNIIIDNGNTISVQVKNGVKPFKSYDDYYNRLISDTCILTRNAQDDHRKHKYGIVTTISKGYDSPACAVVAKAAGYNTALTFSATGKHKNDSGVEIAKRLGYTNIIEKDAMDFRSNTDLVEADYLCTGELGSSISSGTFDKYYRKNMVYTGDRGDPIWSVQSSNRNSDFKFVDFCSHLGNSERRLWVGYLSVPMPLYGASAWPSIYDISNSKEMAAWQLGNNYDRPIPRRMIEDAGVPREWFGFKKQGAGFQLHNETTAGIRQKLSPNSSDSFEKYVAAHKKFYPMEVISYYWTMKWIYVRQFLLKIGVKKITKIIAFDKEWISSIVNPTIVRYLIPWASDVMRKKYKKAIK